MLRVRVLGELEVEGSAGLVELGGSWRARSILAWLALHPGEHLRSDLASRFWPDVLDSSARASLRNSLWAIRRGLGPDEGALVTTRERVGLGLDVQVDAIEFREHLDADRLDEALALVRGELLAGMEDEWILEERDSHREALSALLERLAARAEADEDLADAIALSRRRVALDPLDEGAARALMARLALSGDRAAALAVYERIRNRFRSELGISVSEETRALAGEVREGPARVRPPVGAANAQMLGTTGEEVGSWEPGEPFPLPARLRRQAPGSFVGRQQELRALQEHWEIVAGGGGARLVTVAGEPGVGKSRLARELALDAARSGAAVLHGSTDEDLLVLHQPLVTALGHYLEVASPAELDRRVAPRAADLEPVAPGIDVPAPDGAGSTESRRYRLFEAVAALLSDLSGAVPVLIVIDDLHWADQSTIAILRHAFESRPEMRLMVVATQRTIDAPTGDTAEALARLSRSDFAFRLPLGGLSEPDVAELAAGLGSGLSSDIVRGIHRQTGGNPFFVAEIVTDFRERGEPSLVALEQSDVPPGIGELLGLRLGRLSDDCTRLLTVAAVIGSEFRLAPLERVSDLQGDDLTAALDEAMAADILVEIAAGEHEAFAFSHALLRRTLLTRVSQAHQRRIHVRVAEALETTEGDAALLEIAHHLCEARPVSDRERALDYAVRAAERATQGLAYAEAVDLFTRARLLLPEGDERRRKLALKRAVAYQALFHAAMDTPAPESGAERAG